MEQLTKQRHNLGSGGVDVGKGLTFNDQVHVPLLAEREGSQGKYLKSKGWHYEGKGQEREGFLTCGARRRLVLTLDGDKTSVQERSSNIFNF